MRAIATDTTAMLLKEQFIPDHVLVYVAKGGIRFFDGNKTYTLKAGECCIARKNRLAKFIISPTKEPFEPILFCFDEPFLLDYQKRHNIPSTACKNDDAFIKLPQSSLLDHFMQSLAPYHEGIMQLDEAFEDVKYEELLLILLKINPELSSLLFDFGKPGKIDLEKFMNDHYRFNVSVERFAFLTGRSLSAFKRDFKAIFGETPNRWLVQKRLQEAYFLIEKKNKKPSDIYLDLGFEALSHFSFAFKKQFNIAPSELAKQ